MSAMAAEMFTSEQEAMALTVFRDIAGLIDVEGYLEPLTDHDRRGVIAQVMSAFVMSPDFEELMLRKADWIAAGTAEGGAPCDDPQAVADGIRRTVALMRVTI